MEHRPNNKVYRQALAAIEEANRHSTYPNGIIRYSLTDEYDEDPVQAMGRVWVKTHRATCLRPGCRWGVTPTLPQKAWRTLHALYIYWRWDHHSPQMRANRIHNEVYRGYGRPRKETP